METIIVDDGSTPEHRVENMVDLFPLLNIRVIRLERTAEWRGPTVAYNTGFNEARGDVIVINSSECVHIGNITGFIEKSITEDNYIAFSACMGTTAMAGKVFSNDPANFTAETKNYGTWWGVHSTIGNFIPYCAAISKKNMDLLGGYDMRYVQSVGWDDYDFTHRVNNLGLMMKCIDNPFCYHQWHPETKYPNKNNLELLERLNITEPNRIKANG